MLADVLLFRVMFFAFERALEDLNPRHQVLETCVLPTELRAHKLVLDSVIAYNFFSLTQSDFYITLFLSWEQISGKCRLN